MTAIPWLCNWSALTYWM